MKQVMFIRHGAVERHEGIYPDEEDVGLTSIGETELLALRPIVQNFDPEAIVSSQVRRCKESTLILSSVVRCPLSYDGRLRERAFPSMYGLAISDVRRQYGDRTANYLCHESEKLDLPGEENVNDAQARVMTSFKDIVRSSISRVAIVSHGGPHSWLLCGMFNLPVSAARRFDLGTARFSIFGCGEDGQPRRVLVLNGGSRPLP